jgi:hypothetical protein
MKSQIEKASAGLVKPEPPQRRLTLPTAGKEGVRIFLKLKPLHGHPPLNYKAPAVEAVTTTEVERKALSFPGKSRTLSAADLRRWLEQIYPPAIMDSSGEPPQLRGTLTLAPAGSDKSRRFATLKGDIAFTLDDRAETTYRGTLEAVVTYDAGKDDFVSLSGVFEGMFPKSDVKRGRSMEFALTAVIESTTTP